MIAKSQYNDRERKGNPKLHCLKIIKIFKADFNFCLKTVFGDRIMGFASKYYDLKDIQYVSLSGGLCYSTILNKILTYDNLRAAKRMENTQSLIWLHNMIA